MKTFKINQIVKCPSDRGESGYPAKVISVESDVHETHNGTKYVWVTVQRIHGHTQHVWPSNRLG